MAGGVKRRRPSAMTRCDRSGRRHLAGAAAGEVQRRFAQGGVDVGQAQHAVEEVVVRHRLAGAGAQAGQVEAAAGREAVGDPQLHRHPGLFGRGDGVRRAMQVEAVFAQRFAVVGDVQHRRVDRRVVAQHRGGAADDVVGVMDGVVVGVMQLLVVALLQLVAAAFRLEGRELGRVARVVGRAVAAEQVDHEHGVALDRWQVLLQLAQQHLVVAALRVAQRRILAVAEELLGGAHGEPLAAGVVVDPDHVVAGAHQHVEQVLAVLRHAVLVLGAADAAEHARQRRRGVGAAAVHVAEVHGRQRAHLRVGVAAVTEAAVAGGAGGFLINSYFFSFFTEFVVLCHDDALFSVSFRR